MNRIVVIGASAGGVATLRELARNLPENLRAAVFVVVHLPSHYKSALPDILSKAGPIPARHAVDGESFLPGRIYVAPPGQHLLIDNDTIQLSYGPRENGHRPAIDPLFRSAARAHGSRVIGVVLSGALYDGTAGLISVKRNGGVSISQDPREALFPGMPLHAIEKDHVDFVLTIAEIVDKITQLVNGPAQEENSGRSEHEPDDEMNHVQKDVAAFESGEPANSNIVLVCPACGGVLWEEPEGNVRRYLCHVGHRYTEQNLLASQTDTLERALWSAIRALEERASLLRRLAVQSRREGRTKSAELFEGRARDAEDNADSIRQVIISGGTMSDLENFEYG